MVVESLLGLDNQSTPDLKATISRGLPFESLETLAINGSLSVEGLAHAFGLNPAKLIRRKEQGRLTAGESDHLVSVANAIACAIRFFSGNKEKAANWFLLDSPALGNISPLEMTKTRTGCRMVEDLLPRLAHGVFS